MPGLSEESGAGVPPDPFEPDPPEPEPPLGAGVPPVLPPEPDPPEPDPLPPEPVPSPSPGAWGAVDGSSDGVVVVGVVAAGTVGVVAVSVDETVGSSPQPEATVAPARASAQIVRTRAATALWPEAAGRT